MPAHKDGDPPVEPEQSSTGSGIGDDGLTVDPGAPFSAGEDRSDELGAESEALPVAPELEPAWSEETVRANLIAQGLALHGLVAIDKESDEWLYIDSELDLIVPPLTRLCNRYPVMRRFATIGDFPALAVGFASYGKRSLETRGESAAAVALADETPEETGQAPFAFGAPA